MILLWGILEDKPLATVYDTLNRMGAPVVLVDQDSIFSTELDLSIGYDVEGILRVSKGSIDLSSITCSYLRPYALRELFGSESSEKYSDRKWQHAVYLEEALSSWLELTPTLVINRLTSMSLTNSKPFQLTQIQSVGFKIPETIVTTDPREVMKFWQRHGTVIYKSISGVRSIISRLTSKHLDLLGNVAWCPTQFQEYIPGNDYRVHVVGKEIFCCRISSKADDYRYAHRRGESVHIVPFTLPEEIGSKCKRLATSMGLIVAGIDLRLAENGDWYCFEINPSPGFTYYQDFTGHRIDTAIARLLASTDETNRNSDTN
jgi:hypothetical protein